MRMRLALVGIAVAGCGIPDLPDRDSPPLVQVERSTTADVMTAEPTNEAELGWLHGFTDDSDPNLSVSANRIAVSGQTFVVVNRSYTTHDENCGSFSDDPVYACTRWSEIVVMLDHDGITASEVGHLGFVEDPEKAPVSGHGLDVEGELRIELNQLTSPDWYRLGP